MAEPAGVADAEKLYRSQQDAAVEILRRDTEQAIFRLRHRMLQMFRLLSHEQGRVDRLEREIKRPQRRRRETGRGAHNIKGARQGS